MVVSFVSGIRVDKSETFRSRLKQWQKMGFPDGTKVGKGVKAEYGASQVLQLILLVKLLRIGLTPERAQYVIKNGWKIFKAGFVEALNCMRAGETHLHYFFVQLDALSDLTSPTGSGHMHIFINVLSDDEMLMAWDDADPEWAEEHIQEHSQLARLVKDRLYSSITIEIDSLFFFLWAALEAIDKGPEIFSEEFLAWDREAQAQEAVFQSSQKHFDNDTFNQSIAQRTNNMDGKELAQRSLPLDISRGHP